MDLDANWAGALGILLLGVCRCGAVFIYVWDADNGNWVEETKLTPSDAGLVGRGEGFGKAVSLHGDVLVVGAPDDDQNGENAGAVYVFRRSNAGWSEEVKLTPSDAADRAGTSVAVHGDHLAFGGPGTPGLQTRGKLWFFRNADGRWNPNGGGGLSSWDFARAWLRGMLTAPAASCQSVRWQAASWADTT